jgi:mRNA interferase RelE/StbE
VASYRIQVKPSAAKELEAVPLKDRRRLVTRMRAPGKDPRPAGCEKLSGREKYRVRQGDYRIVFSVDDSEQTVLVVRVGHRRRDVYR